MSSVARVQAGYEGRAVASTVAREKLPLDVVGVIFSYLKLQDARFVEKVSKVWYDCAQTALFEEWTTIIGDKVWSQHGFQVPREPLLPNNIFAILSKPCRFSPDKTVAQTHYLIFIPGNLDEGNYGDPLTLDIANEHLLEPISEIVAYTLPIESKARTKSCNSHWVLITRERVPDSLGKTCAEQEAFVNNSPYKISTILEVVSTVAMLHLAAGKNVLGTKEHEFVRCADRVPVGEEQYFATIGPFLKDGIVISALGGDASQRFGVMYCRRFPEDLEAPSGQAS